MSEKRDELLGCPFCGGSDIDALDHLDYVCCQGCGASLEDVEPSARELWNTRASAQPMTETKFYGAECPSYPDCSGGCGLGCTHEVLALSAAMTGTKELLESAQTVALQEIHDAVNALGGRSDQDNSYDQGIVDTVNKVLEIIEKAQAGSSAFRAQPRIEEAAWLIEWPADDNVPVRWWHPVDGWMRDANKAMRLSRSCDAAAYIASHKMVAGVKPTEHVWLAAIAAQPTRVQTPTIDEISSCGSENDYRRAQPTEAAKPIAWVIPGDDNAREDGSIDAMAWQEGEFSRPLFAAQPTEAPAGEVLDLPTLDEYRNNLIEECAKICDRWIRSKNLHEHLAALDIARDIRALAVAPERGEK